MGRGKRTTASGGLGAHRAAPLVPVPATLRPVDHLQAVPAPDPAAERRAALEAFEARMRHGQKIKTKGQMYELYEQGAFGNKLRTWSSVEDYLASDYQGTVTLRYASAKGGGGFAAYEVPRDKVEETVAEWQSRGADRKLVRVNESAPDHDLTVQGEVSRVPHTGQLCFRFSTVQGKMRDAMKQSEHVYGVEALALLRHYLTGASYEDLEELLDLYPTAVVEFSAYRYPVGECRGRNAVVWEVRDY